MSYTNSEWGKIEGVVEEQQDLVEYIERIVYLEQADWVISNSFTAFPGYSINYKFAGVGTGLAPIPSAEAAVGRSLRITNYVNFNLTINPISGTNNFLINGAQADTIVLTQWQSILMYSNGQHWIITRT